MRWITRAAVLALGVSAVAAGLTGVAAATAGKHVVKARQTTHLTSGKRPSVLGALPSAMPPKYVVVNSGSLASVTGTQTRGSAVCPANTVPYGGGVFVGATSLTVNVNSSIPTGTGWIADVNNASGSSTSFTVYAVCAKRNSWWSIVTSSAVTVNASGQARASVSCPTGAKIMGGGGFSNSGSTSVNQNSSFPVKSGSGKSATFSWFVDENNASTAPSSVTAYAVCGHAKGYTFVAGTSVSNPAGAQTEATATCPSGKVPMGGGVFSSSGSVSVNTNTTYPLSSGWAGFENNASTGTATVTTFAVCAGT